MKFLSQQLCFSPNIYIYKAILVGVLQGLYFLPIHDSWAFIPIFFFLLHCWFLLDLFSHSQNPQKLLLFSYLFLLPSCAIRYGWIFSSLWIYGNYNWVSSLFFYFLGVHWIILIHLVCFSAVFFLYALFYKRLLKIDEIDNYAKITLFIISYFGARLLLDYSSVPGGEWVENPFLGNLLAPAFSIVGSHVLDSWIYFLILLIFCSIKKKTIPKVFLLAIYSIFSLQSFFANNPSLVFRQHTMQL